MPDLPAIASLLREMAGMMVDLAEQLDPAAERAERTDPFSGTTLASRQREVGVLQTKAYLDALDGQMNKAFRPPAPSRAEQAEAFGGRFVTKFCGHFIASGNDGWGGTYCKLLAGHTGRHSTHYPACQG